MRLWAFCFLFAAALGLLVLVAVGLASLATVIASGGLAVVAVTLCAVEVAEFLGGDQ